MPLGAVRAHAPRPSRTVAEIRPRPAVTLEAGMPVADAAKRMQAANSDAALVCERVGSEWKVRGILTDTDVMRKVVAAGRDPDPYPHPHPNPISTIRKRMGSPPPRNDAWP